MIIKIAKNILKRVGIIIQKKVTDKDISKLLSKIRPRICKTQLLRVGEAEDGGYLIPSDLDNIDYCFSPGVAERYSFEQELFQKFDIKSHMCDKTVEIDVSADFVASFTQKHLGLRNNSETITFDDWVNTFSDNSPNLLLQMDIEAAEIPVIILADQRIINKFKYIIIEIHCLDRLQTSTGFELYDLFFQKLCHNHTPVHLHINNNGGTFKCGTEQYPNVIELTLLRNDDPNCFGDFSMLPNNLDRLNRPGQPEISIPSIWCR